MCGWCVACLIVVSIQFLPFEIQSCQRIKRMNKGEGTLDLWGTAVSLKSSNLNGIILKFWQLGTITYSALIITVPDSNKLYKSIKIIWINIFEDIFRNVFCNVFLVWKCVDPIRGFQ